MTASSLRGVLPVLATPFTAELQVDLPSLATLTRWQVGAGAGGVAVFGFASEFFTLDARERAQILQVVREQLPTDRALIAGVSSTGTAEAVALAAEAARGGATHLMVLPPHVVAPTPAQLVTFYRDVAAVGLPIMIQDAPGHSRVQLPVELICELAQIPGVDSVKVETQPTTPKLAAIAQAAPAGFEVLGGQNALFCLEELDRGSVGTMPACEFTDLLVPVVRDFLAGRASAARAAFTALLPLVRFGLQPGIAWAIHKHVLVRRGLIECGAVRAPAREIDDWTRAWIEQLLADLHIAAERR